MKPVTNVIIGLLIVLSLLACVSESLSARWQSPAAQSSITPATITVFRSRSTWKNTVGVNKKFEDFESEATPGSGLSFPYLTGNSFLLTGHCHAFILNYMNFKSGYFLDIRDCDDELTITFPNNESVTAFGFDYRLFDPWQLSIEGSKITLLEDSKSFVGVIITGSYINAFVLDNPGREKGGLVVDNISYVTR